ETDAIDILLEAGVLEQEIGRYVSPDTFDYEQARMSTTPVMAVRELFPEGDTAMGAPSPKASEEKDKVPSVRALAGNLTRVTEYITQSALYGPPDKCQQTLAVVFDLFLKHNRCCEALRMALRTEDEDMVGQVFAKALEQKPADPVLLRQLAHILALHGGRAASLLGGKEALGGREDLWRVVHNHELWRHYRQVITDLDLLEARNPEDITKLHMLDGGERVQDNKLSLLGNVFLNGFVHAGHWSDTLLEQSSAPVVHSSVPPSGLASPAPEHATGIEPATPAAEDPSAPKQRGLGNWVLPPKFKDVSVALATASAGLLHMWDGPRNGMNRVAAYLNSPNAYVQVGGLLAAGLCTTGTSEPVEGVEPLLCLVQRYVNPYYNRTHELASVQTEIAEMQQECAWPAKEINRLTSLSCTCGALSLGIAYSGSHNAAVADVLAHRLRLCSDRQQQGLDPLAKQPRSMCCLALGLNMAGSASLPHARIITRLIAGYSRTQRTLRLFPLSCIALGLIFLKRPAEGRAYVRGEMVPLLLSVPTPDSAVEQSGVPTPAENAQLAAYMESIVSVCSNAFSGDVFAIQALLQGITEAQQGRAAAEAAVQRRTHREEQAAKEGEAAADDDSPWSVPTGTGKGEKRPGTTRTGAPVRFPRATETLWTGENTDPVSVLTLGIGAVCGDDHLTVPLVMRLMDRVNQHGSEEAKRAVPFALAMTSLSNPDPVVTDSIGRLAHSQDT
ncbi:26S proteasome regulatory complex, non-ATPase subcomplex, Rpn1 subunit, partial [Kipferlia bialata]